MNEDDIVITLKGAKRARSVPETPMGMTIRAAAVPFSGVRLYVLPTALRTVPSVLRSSEQVTGYVTRYEQGYGETTGAIVEVEEGTSAVCNFDMTITAYAEEDFTSVETSLTQNMSDSEREEYHRVVAQAGGGFGGILGWFGFRAGGSYTNESITQARNRDSKYDEHSQLVANHMRNVHTSRIRIWGTLTATGVSMLPTRVRAWIQVATITFYDGSTRTVVRTSAANPPNAVAATPGDGTTVNTSGVQLNVQKL